MDPLLQEGHQVTWVLHALSLGNGLERSLLLHWPLRVDRWLSTTNSCWDWTEQMLHPALPLCPPPAAPGSQAASSLLQEESGGAEMLQGTGASFVHVPPSRRAGEGLHLSGCLRRPRLSGGCSDLLWKLVPRGPGRVIPSEACIYLTFFFPVLCKTGVVQGVLI